MFAQHVEDSSNGWDQKTLCLSPSVNISLFSKQQQLVLDCYEVWTMYSVKLLMFDNNIAMNNNLIEIHMNVINHKSIQKCFIEN